MISNRFQERSSNSITDSNSEYCSHKSGTQLKDKTAQNLPALTYSLSPKIDTQITIPILATCQYQFL